MFPNVISGSCNTDNVIRICFLYFLEEKQSFYLLQHSWLDGMSQRERWSNWMEAIYSLFETQCAYCITLQRYASFIYSCWSCISHQRELCKHGTTSRLNSGKSVTICSHRSTLRNAIGVYKVVYVCSTEGIGNPIIFKQTGLQEILTLTRQMLLASLSWLENIFLHYKTEFDEKLCQSYAPRKIGL